MKSEKIGISSLEDFNFERLIFTSELPKHYRAFYTRNQWRSLQKSINYELLQLIGHFLHYPDFPVNWIFSCWSDIEFGMAYYICFFFGSSVSIGNRYKCRRFECQSPARSQLGPEISISSQPDTQSKPGKTKIVDT